MSKGAAPKRGEKREARLCEWRVLNVPSRNPIQTKAPKRGEKREARLCEWRELNEPCCNPIQNLINMQQKPIAAQSTGVPFPEFLLRKGTPIFQQTQSA